MNRIKFILLSVLLALLTACNSNQSKKDIESKINSLYSKHEYQSIYTISSLEYSLFSDSLAGKIKNLRKLTNEDAERIENSNQPTAKPIMLGGNAFCSLSDGFQKYTIKEIKIKDKTAEVAVELEYSLSDPKTIWMDKVILINENGWKINEIEFDIKIISDKNLTSRLAAVNTIGEILLTDIDGEQLKFDYGIEGDAVSVTFKGETRILTVTSSANGVRYADKNEEYVFWEHQGSHTYYKGDEVIFSYPEKWLKYTEANNYFVKNSYPKKEVHSVKINSDADLNKIFGAATTMGKDGTPTKIDFVKHYAIAVIGKTNDEGNKMEISGLMKLKNEISLNVFIHPIKKGKKQSYTSRPFKILIIDKKYQGNIKINSFPNNN
jgi:hypothetical protein